MVVKKRIEIFLSHRVGGVVIEEVLLEGNLGSGGRDQTPAPVRSPDAVAICVVCIGSVYPK